MYKINHTPREGDGSCSGCGNYSYSFHGRVCLYCNPPTVDNNKSTKRKKPSAKQLRDQEEYDRYKRGWDV